MLVSYRRTAKPSELTFRTIAFPVARAGPHFIVSMNCMHSQGASRKGRTLSYERVVPWYDLSL
jgi:hypothetical protein